MKNNITKFTQINSKRAQEFIANPKYFLKNEKPGWGFELVRSDESLLGDKFLTLTYFKFSNLEIDNLFCESLSQMCVGKNIAFLIKLTFREVENYLRDENHLPVFEETSSSIIEKSYKMVKNSLLASVIMNKIQDTKFHFREGENWKSLGLVQKNRLIADFVTTVQAPFVLVRPLQLVFVENDTVSVVINDFPIELEALEMLCNRFFKSEDAETYLKFVAVH